MAAAALWIAAVLALQGAAAASGDVHEDAAASPPLLLPDRLWFSQVARVRQRHKQSPPHSTIDACVAVSDALVPGARVQGYELVERTALLGVCTLQHLPAGGPEAPPLFLDVTAALDPWDLAPYTTVQSGNLRPKDAVVPVYHYRGHGDDGGGDGGDDRDESSAVCPLIPTHDHRAPSPSATTATPLQRTAPSLSSPSITAKVDKHISGDVLDGPVLEYQV